MITLVVADDHPVVRQGLVALLGTDPDIEVIGEAADGSEATEVVLSLRPSVVVMDLQMPVVDGVAATQAIKQVWPEAAIVVLTTYDSDEAIVRALEAGASGFVLKDTPPDDLIQAIRRAATGETVSPGGKTARRTDAVSGVCHAVEQGNRGVAGGGERQHQQCYRRSPSHKSGDGQDPPAAHLHEAWRL
jgi:DNA-binding NarL/FixJ family response regulator